MHRQWLLDEAFRVFRAVQLVLSVGWAPAVQLFPVVRLVLAARLVPMAPAALFVLAAPRVQVVRSLLADRSLPAVPAALAATPQSRLRLRLATLLLLRHLAIRLQARLRRVATQHRRLLMAVRLGRRRVLGRPILSPPPWAVPLVARRRAMSALVWAVCQPVALVPATPPRSRRLAPWSQ